MSEVAESGMTAGGLLKEARQAAGMHIAALAVALKVPPSYQLGFYQVSSRHSTTQPCLTEIKVVFPI